MIRLLNRLKVFRQFALGELIILLTGKLFGKKSPDRFNKLQQREINLVKALQIDHQASINEQEVELKYSVSQKYLTFFLRIKGSDVWVFNQVIQAADYSILNTLYLKFFGTPPKNFVDAGANIGLVSIYFASLYPDIQILAVEPDPENCKMARKNFSANNIRNMDLFELALWPVSTNLKIVNDFRDGLSWSLRVEEDNSGAIATITPEAIVKHVGSIDILKMDVEGGEDKLFGNECDLEWLTHVKMIAIEIHDEQTDRQRIVSHLKSKQFSIQEHGELTIGINTSILSTEK